MGLAVKRAGLALLLSALLVGVVPATAVEAAPPMVRPTVDVGWNWWLMQGYAKFTPDETRIMAQAGVTGAVAYAISWIPDAVGKAAAAAMGVVLWATSANAFNQGRCTEIYFGTWIREVRAVDC